jgi:hypothetical protein
LPKITEASVAVAVPAVERAMPLQTAHRLPRATSVNCFVEDGQEGVNDGRLSVLGDSIKSRLVATCRLF